MSKQDEMIGKKFERFLVLRKISASNTRHILYLCQCDCGNLKPARGSGLRSGQIKSCGCWHKDQAKSIGHKNKKHGLCGSRTYTAYLNAKARCGRDKNYENVKFHFSSVEEIIKEIGPCPKDKLLDRIDPYLDYESGNIRWVDNSLSSSNIKSEARGVRESKYGTFYAIISINNKQIFLGSFNNFFDAHQEYLRYYFLKYNEYPAEFRV